MVLRIGATRDARPRLHSPYVALNPRTTGCGRIMAVRRTLCLALLVVAAGAVGAIAWASTPATEGTLSIKRGDGMLILDIKGAAVGRLRKGELAVEIPASRTCEDLKVWGADSEDEEEAPDIDLGAGEEAGTVCLFSGTRIRFRLTGKLFIEVRDARNLFVSAAETGWGLIEGIGGADGVWSRNGRREWSVPNKPTSFELQPDEDERSANAAE